MLKTLFKNWWVLLLKGVVSIIFGLLAFMNPGVTAATLVLWLAIFLLIDGVLSILATFRSWGENDDKWLLLLEGVVNLLLGILLLRSPEAGMLAAAFYLAFWAIISGVARIAMAIQLRKQIDSEWSLGLSGLLSILFGVLVLSNPGAGVVSIMWMIGTVAILVGILLIVVAFKLRGMGNKIEEATAAAKAGLSKLGEELKR